MQDYRAEQRFSSHTMEFTVDGDHQPTMPTESSSSERETLESGSQSGTTFRKEGPELEAGVVYGPPVRRRLWYNHISRIFESRFPKAHGRISRVVLYARGPSPPVPLSSPRPFLNLDFQPPRFMSMGWPERVTIPIEAWFMRKTRLFNRTWLMLLFGAGYIIALAFLTRAQWFTIPAESFMTCTSSYWSKNDGCGLNGDQCSPFTNITFDFRCPAQCSSVILQNPRAVGTEMVDFVPLVVGGGNSGNASFPGSYRGDSFICAAAIHAGIIDDSTGGCASLSLVGTQGPFESSTSHGLTSTAFPSFFPLSLQFSSTTSLKQCTDLRNWALAFNILASCVIFFLLRPKPLVLYWCLVCMGYWHIIFFSQPAGAPPSISNAFGTFLPALFFCHAFWELAWRHVLPFFSQMPIERAIWYLCAFWPGVLFNILTDKIPIDRLLGSDLAKRPGAVVALIVIIIVLVVIIINQLRVIRKTGWLPYYVGAYIIAGLIIMVLALLPGLQFRLHHYFAAILLVPITAFPTRLSAIYQAFLLGMFLNGCAAFGFDSILQTPAELQRDAPAGTLLPSLLTNSSTYNSSIPILNQTLRWETFPADDGWNGFALLIDDVERYVGNALNLSLAALDATVPHFFRLAFQQDGTSGDFTQAATLWPNGSWINEQPGPS